MPISAVDAFNPAFEHAKQQLLQPFRFGQWVRLAFVGLLAGEAGSGGGCNVNVPAPQHKGSGHALGAHWPPVFANHPAELVAVIVLFVVAIFALVALFLYVSSMMRFVLFDSVVTKVCRVRQGWIRRRNQGWQYFVWQLFFGLATTVLFVVLLGVPVLLAWKAGWFSRPADHLFSLILFGISMFLLFMLALISLAVVHVLTKDFVVPQMALENISVIEGWRRLWLWIKNEKAGYASYVGMKLVLALAAAIGLGIISMIVFLILLVPIGGAGLIAVFAGAAAGLTWNFFTIALAIIIGAIALGGIFFVMALISVPAIVFFPAYSIYFFAPRYPPLAAVLWPQPATPVPPPQFPAPPTAPAF